MKEIIKTDKAPAAIGPYSQGYKAGDFIFISGQGPLDPQTGRIRAIPSRNRPGKHLTI